MFDPFYIAILSTYKQLRETYLSSNVVVPPSGTVGLKPNVSFGAYDMQ